MYASNSYPFSVSALQHPDFNINYTCGDTFLTHHNADGDTCNWRSDPDF
jgi:hypothetical protein